MNIIENKPLSELTTIRLGGNALYLFEINEIDDIEKAYSLARDKQLATYVIGGGSNIIGHDEGYNGAILLNKLKGIKQLDDNLNDDETTVRVMSGEVLDDICDFTAKRGYTGMEALSSIPGTVGGAVMQNSGAYGQQLSDCLVSVSVYDTEIGEIVELSKDELGFGYRTSIFNSTARGRYFVISATVKLIKGEIEGELFQSLQDYLDQHEVEDRAPFAIRRAVMDIRAHKLPDPAVEASAGSFFKNYSVNEADIPELKSKHSGIPIFNIGGNWEIASGWLIEKAGLKGQTLHGMRVSDKAALILINDSASSYADLAAARAEIIATVQEKFGFTLEQEPEEILVSQTIS